jgi:hypothetical protein
MFPFRPAAEKERLAKEHQQALDVQRTNFSELKEHLRAAESRHSRELKEVRAAAEAKLNESLEEYTNSTAVLRAELEEQTKAREDQSKARETAENQVSALMMEQKDYDRLVIQTDTLLLSKSFFFPFTAYKLRLSGSVFLSSFFSCRDLSGLPGVRQPKGGGAQDRVVFPRPGASLGCI